MANKRVGGLWFNDEGRWGVVKVKIRGVPIALKLQKNLEKRTHRHPDYLVYYDPVYNEEFDPLLPKEKEEIPF